MVQARKIFHHLNKEVNKQLLFSVREELLNATTKEFWEVSERGTNFVYLDPALHNSLFRFFKLFPWSGQTEYWEQFQKSAEGKSLRVQQELMNFETKLVDDEEQPDDEDEEYSPDEDTLSDVE